MAVTEGAEPWLRCFGGISASGKVLSYIADFDTEKGDIALNNDYGWNTFPEISDR